MNYHNIFCIICIGCILSFQITFNTNNSIPKKYNWNAFVKENGIPISFQNLDNKSNFQFIKDHLGNEKIIMLGEQSHCCKEYNFLKGKLVRFLHEQMGFDVIAFETSMNGYCLKNLIKKNLSLDEFSTGTWDTKENIELFEFIKDSMELAGIDIIPQYRSQYLKNLFWQLDTNLAKFCEKVDYSLSELDKNYIKNNKMIAGNGKIPHYEFVSQDSVFPFQKKAKELMFLIDSTKAIFNRNKDFLKISSKEQLIVEKSFENKKIFIRYLLNKHNYLFRDSIMGQNLKIIVWAANTHIRINGILSNQFTEKRYSLGISNACTTAPELFKSDAIFIDLSKFRNIHFTHEEHNNIIKNYDAIILVKNTTSCEPRYNINK
jgi:erythromycin esterase